MHGSNATAMTCLSGLSNEGDIIARFRDGHFDLTAYDRRSIFIIDYKVGGVLLCVFQVNS